MMNFNKDFVVHNYSTTSTQPSQSLLYTAYELIRNTHHGYLDWVNVVLANTSPLIKFSPTKKLVQYPPFLENLHEKRVEDQDHRINVDWGVPILELDDVFTLKDLEEFRTTDLSFIFDIRSEEIPLNLLVHSTLSSQQLPSIEEGPLHGAIPQPHVHPTSSLNLIGLSKLIPYTKTKPILIPPRTEPFLPSPYSRSAWLIPIRGKPPWEQCTAAVVLNSSYDALHPDLTNRGEIIWTFTSIRSFWDFLLEIKASGSAGAIGFSFHASRNAPLISQSNHTVSSVMPGNQQSMVASNVTLLMESNKSTVAPRALLSAVDYIKIYHEGLNAMHLRNILHLWSYTEPQLLRKIRILRGATLALMDERSTGILLS